MLKTMNTNGREVLLGRCGAYSGRSLSGSNQHCHCTWNIQSWWFREDRVLWVVNTSFVLRCAISAICHFRWPTDFADLDPYGRENFFLLNSIHVVHKYWITVGHSMLIIALRWVQIQFSWWLRAPLISTPAPQTTFLEVVVVNSSLRVPMGLTDRRKPAKSLADSRKNWKILTVSRK